MSDSTSAQVECPICEEEFDPTAAGGWCTNEECGEWQYIGDEVPEAADAAAESDSDPTPVIRRIDDSDPEATAESAADEARASGESAPAAEEACPECGAAIDPDDNFCAACGADLETAEEAPLDACPSCGADVDEDDSFCANCGDDLDGAREAREPPEADDGSGDAESAAAAGEAAPKSLVLRARGREIAVTDDDTVGREVRRLITETGGDEDDAVRIHREHVRFVREDGRFYVVDLGDNPTALNGRQLSKGDREPVEPGDELELSGVVTLSVDRP